MTKDAPTPEAMRDTKTNCINDRFTNFDIEGLWPFPDVDAMQNANVSTTS
jgi:hypothetical protein